VTPIPSTTHPHPFN